MELLLVRLRSKSAARLLALIVVAAASAKAAGAPPLSLPVQEHRLRNGLRVVLAPDPAMDEVTVIVRYEVGSSDDPAGKDGLAHVVEHLMFGGSRHVGLGEFCSRIEQAGGTNINGRTNLDSTQYVETVPPELLATVFWLESDRMGFLADRINQAALEREQTLIADEIRGKVVDPGLGSLSAVTNSQIFPAWHPYYRELETSSLKGITVADVKAFLRTWYTPRNAMVVVAGGFDAAETLALAEKYFGDLPGDDPPQRPVLPSWRVPDARVDVAAGVNGDVVMILWKAPPFGQTDDLALDLAAAILTDPTGRLQRALVSKGLAVSVGSREQSMHRASTFSIWATVSPKAQADDVVRAIEEVVGDLASSLTDEEYARTHGEWIDSDLFQLETSLGRANRLASGEGTFDFSAHGAIQIADVRRAVKATLVPNERAVVVVHHDPHAPPRGRIVARTERSR